MNMNENNLKVQESINTAKNVEQIRNIIFGTQTKEFDTRITQLSENLQTIEKKLTQMIYDSHIKLRTESERSFATMEKMLEDIRATIVKDRIATKEQINVRDVNLQNQMGTHNALLVSKLNNLKHVVDEEKRINHDNLYRVKDEIQKIIELEFKHISENKLSRNKMSEMFLDIAMRLQNESSSHILEEGMKSEK